MKKIIVVFFLSLIFISSCKKDQIKLDDDIIQDYLQENNIDAQKHESGLYYLITLEGDGEFPDTNSDVTVKYKGYLTDGEVFDETGDEAVTFNLSQLISGWKIGIPLLSRGGQGIFFIPSNLGYGEYQAGVIPPNSVLIFEIELIDFSK